MTSLKELLKAPSAARLRTCKTPPRTAAGAFFQWSCVMYVSKFSRTSLFIVSALLSLIVAQRNGLILANHTSSATSVESATSTTLFFDDFNDGNADGWTTAGLGTWSVENSEYVVDMDSGYDRRGTSLAGDLSWTDYIFECDVQGNLGVDKHFYARYFDDNNFYSVNFRADPYGDVVLLKFEGGAQSVLSSTPYPSSNNVWYHVKMRLQGPRIIIYVNDTLLIDYTDAGSSLTHGKIGLVGWTGAWGSDVIRFDNVVVRSVGNYSISGRVTDATNNLISGVIVSSNSGGSAITNASGVYTITDIITGTYTITPTLNGYRFAPVTRTVTLPPSGMANFGSPDLSGKVRFMS
jgi:hypothetical protein